MLFTRCPECDTTFRITADALRKADGQVRCGRCACVFNAYTELRRGTSEAYCDDGVVRKTLPADPLPPLAASGADGDGAPLAERPEPSSFAESGEPLPECATFIEEWNPAPEGENDGEAPPAEAAGAARQTESGRGSTSAAAGADRAEAEPALDDVTLADVIHELEASADEPAAEPSSDPQADAPRAEAAPNEPPTWIVLEGEASERSSRKWTFGCIAAALLLAVQVTHHYRAQLAATALVGPWLRSAYAFLGSDVAPHWDLAQYEILDWTAIAEPNSEGQGSLTIAARLYNRGPRTQPFPHVQVQLKDRWERTVGSRIFSPSEYLSADVPANGEMHAGKTAKAELSIVDPGPDAYGFELDVCIPRNGGELRCAADEVFR